MKPNSMLARMLGVEIPDADAAVTALQTDFDAFKATAAAEQATLTTALTTAIEANTALEAERDTLKTQLEALQAAQAAAAEAAVVSKMDARRVRIEAAIGSERVDAMMAVVANLADENFDTVMAAMAAGAVKESKSDMFQEQGADVTASADVADGESKEMQLIKAKYSGTAA